jgi:pimeloyl-ACP methyl ester carboxylesterase
MTGATIRLDEHDLEISPELLDDLLARRIRSAPGPALLGHAGSAVFHTGDHDWTITVSRSSVSARRGAKRRPTSRIWTDLGTLSQIVAGTTSGAAAFHAGSLTLRGRIAFGLLMDGAFEAPAQRPVTLPVPGQVMAQGVTTNYLAAGPDDAPPVIMLHGIGATNASMLPLFLDMARDHRVIAPDMPGFGASSAPGWDYNAADFAHWMRGLLNRLGIERATIIGNSLGGRVALETGMRFPEVVDRLVLLAPSTAFRRLTGARGLVRLLPPRLGVLPQYFNHAFVTYLLRSMFADEHRLPRPWLEAAVDEFIGVMSSASHRVAFYSALRQVYLEDAFGMAGFWRRLPGLLAPSLFVWGDHDWLVPAAFAEHVKQSLPDASSVVLSRCGHVPQFEHPEQTAGLVRQFLAEGHVSDGVGAHVGYPASDAAMPPLFPHA